MTSFHTSRYFRYRPVRWHRAFICHIWVKTRLRTKISYRKCFFGVVKSFYFSPIVKVYKVNSLLADFFSNSPDNIKLAKQFFNSLKPYGV